MQIAFREFDSDAMRVAVPRPEAQIAVRFGPMARNGLDVAALGASKRAHRKRIRRGMRVVLARLPFDVAESVLGVPAATIAGRIVPLEDLWGDAARELEEKLASARHVTTAAAILEQAIAKRIVVDDRARLAVVAAEKLAHASVRHVATELGVSERQLRRVFRDAVGVSPKAFSRLARFHRAVDAARGGTSWTRIAAETGYCDQAHLIDEFRAIAGTTPRAFMSELLE